MPSICELVDPIRPIGDQAAIRGAREGRDGALDLAGDV
jgi:hypothetical protein